ncbi:hypothetical protein WCD74_03285 [Actinomycetospora sp. OC33-EN08]|uniref:SMI1/KNR4 family protein n=1 Tax=Actinomycetospora aurantiaca TaxID=3129233 RepID=A0ABU8MHT2_9PSEU
MADACTQRTFMRIGRDNGWLPWQAVIDWAEEPIELALLEDLLAAARMGLDLAEVPADLSSTGVPPDGPRIGEVWVNGICFRTTLLSPASGDGEQLEFRRVPGGGHLVVEQWGGAGSTTASVRYGGLAGESPESRDIAVLDVLLDVARDRLDVPRPARYRAPTSGSARRDRLAPPVVVPWSDPDEVPPEIGRLHSLGMTDLIAWRLLTGRRGRWFQVRHDELYPGTQRIPFAGRIDNDDLACVVPMTGEVVVVHLEASAGWEARGTYRDVWHFIEERLIPDLLERLEDDAEFVRHDVALREDDEFQVPVAWPQGLSLPPELARLHGAGLVDLDAWRLLGDPSDDELVEAAPFYPSNSDSPWVLFAQRRERGVRASWNRFTGQVATSPWLADPEDESEARYEDVLSFLAEVVWPDFVVRHRLESAAERRERRLLP